MTYHRADQTFGGKVAFDGGITRLDYPGRSSTPGGTEAERVLGIEMQYNIVLAVSVTGLDDDPARPARIVRGDYSANPFRTVQGAIDALPFRLCYGKASTAQALINIGPGSFQGFYVEGLSASLGLRIVGTRQASVPATGTDSGTATSGATRTLVDTTQTWTPDDLASRYLTITSGPGAGQTLVIATNTADTIRFADPCTPLPAAGSVYQIEDLATVINGPPYRMSAELGAYAAVFFLRNAGLVEIDDLSLWSGVTFGYLGTGNAKVAIRRCRSLYSSYGFVEQDSQAVSWRQLDVLGHGIGIGLYNVANIFNSDRGWSMRNCTFGADVQGCGGNAFYGVYAQNCTYRGLRVLACNLGGLTFFNFRAEACGTAFEAQTSTVGLKSAIINNSTVGCFNLFMANLYIEQLLSGTGNAGWGLYAKGSGNLVQITGFVPTITGASGQVTVDGVTDHGWIGLTTVGSYALDNATGARVNRQ